jgi:glutathione S-transferase
MRKSGSDPSRPSWRLRPSAGARGLTPVFTRTGVDLEPYPNVLAYRKRVAARPAVQAALKAEGLTK